MLGVVIMMIQHSLLSFDSTEEKNNGYCTILDEYCNNGSHLIGQKIESSHIFRGCRRLNI